MALYGSWLRLVWVVVPTIWSKSWLDRGSLAWVVVPTIWSRGVLGGSSKTLEGFWESLTGFGKLWKALGSFLESTAGLSGQTWLGKGLKRHHKPSKKSQESLPASRESYKTTRRSSGPL